jgi:hypothetical protein
VSPRGNGHARGTNQDHQVHEVAAAAGHEESGYPVASGGCDPLTPSPPEQDQWNRGHGKSHGDSALSGHVGTAIHPSVLLVATWVVFGVVTSPFVAARAVRAAITASRASSERRHLSS